MKGLVLTTLLLVVVSGSARGGDVRLVASGSYPTDRSVPCITEEGRAAIMARIEESRRTLEAQGKLAEPSAPQILAFGWPLQAQGPSALDYGFHGISNFVDQDPAYGFVLDYECGSRTYDQNGYNHTGTDIFTWPF